MLYKTAIHIHTKESSECSKISAKEIVSQYKRKGYNTIVITDHCYERYFQNKNLTQWQEMVSYMIKGYEEAKKEGNLQAIQVLFSVELTLNETDSDYLLYGITQELLLNTPYLYQYSLKDLKSWCHKNDILLIQAHPYRGKRIQTANSNEIDGFEIVNGCDAEEKNKKAYQHAKQHHNLMLVGDDAHHISDIGRTGILTRKEVKTIKDFVYVIENQDYALDLPEKNGQDYTFCLPKRNNRYAVCLEHTEKDFVDVWKMEQEYLRQDTISSIKQVIEWEKKNPDIHIFVKDNLQDLVVGEITILPLNDKQYSLFITGNLEDTTITSNELENYEEGKQYNLLISAMAIDKRYRNCPSVFYLLLLALKEKIEKLRRKDISIKAICSEGQTIEGRNISKSFLEKQELEGAEFPIYTMQVKNMNDLENQLDKYLKRYYQLKVKEVL